MSESSFPESINLNPEVVFSGNCGCNVLSNYPAEQFNELVSFTNAVIAERKALADEKEVILSRLESNRKLRTNAQVILNEWQESVKDNEVSDLDAECFSINEVNRLLDALAFSELQITRKYTVQVSVQLSFTVEVEATNEDEARDNVVEDVENNAEWSRALNYVDGEVSEVWADSVDGEAEEA